MSYVWCPRNSKDWKEVRSKRVIRAGVAPTVVARNKAKTAMIKAPNVVKRQGYCACYCPPAEGDAKKKE